MSKSVIVSTTKLRCADGSTCEVAGDSVANYVFDPVFIRFVVLGIIIHSLLMTREYPGISNATEYATLWGVVLVCIVAWIALAGWFLHTLYLKGWIASIYTPLISLPVVPLSEYVSQAISVWLTGITWDASGVTLMLVLKHMGVIICFDIIHMRYVAPIHPLVVSFTQGMMQRKGTVTAFLSTPPAAAAETQTTPQPTAVAPELVPTAPKAPVTTAKQAPRDTIVIKQHMISTADIIAMRTEDHYLSITTKSGDIMVRSKLSDVADELGPALGMIINRSTWVAFNCISATEGISNGRLEISLETGDKFVVPKLRRHSFEQAYRMHQQHSDA